MDEYDLWKDTMLIVTTDHGLLLGEHDWWGKSMMPFYNEIARTPLFLWDPRSGSRAARCGQLTQLIDIAPTLLELFGAPATPDMTGIPLTEALKAEAEGRRSREAVLFGIHGAQVNCTDGQYVYMRAPVHPDNSPLYNYTLMPAHMASLFSVEELRGLELAEPFPFTKGVRTLRIKADSFVPAHRMGTLLYDTTDDPGQKLPLEDKAAEKRMEELLVLLMQASDSPPEQYERLGLA